MRLLSLGFDLKGLLAYLAGTGEPPREAAVGHGQVEHWHWDRQSRRLVGHEETEQDVAA